MRNPRQFETIRRTREHIDHMIIGFAVGLVGILTGIVVIGVNGVA